MLSISKGWFHVQATRKLELVHGDVCGPMHMLSFGNHLYYVTFIDDYLRFAWVYPLKKNSKTFMSSKQFVFMVENVSINAVGTLHSDQGGSKCQKTLMHFWQITR